MRNILLHPINNNQKENTMYTNAFPNGTFTWRELDRLGDEIVDHLRFNIAGMDREEKLYILGIVDDGVSNEQYDLAPKSYTDRVLPFPLVEPPTPMVCDFCGQFVVCTEEPVANEIGSYIHANGYFACDTGLHTARVNGKESIGYRSEDA